jgi:DNA-binding response OmpR family regulator
MISFKGRTILVVDDDPGYREMLKDEFEAYGAKVEVAEDGRKGLAMVQNRPIDAVISDIRMAGLSGVELLDEIKKVSPSKPVVVLITGFSDLTEIDAYAKGAEAVFTKPFDLDDLVKAVNRTLAGSQERWARTTERFASDLAIEFHFDSARAAISAQVLNIGRGGMYIATDGEAKRLPKLADLIHFTVRLGRESSSAFEGNAVCRWVRHFPEGSLAAGFGAEFKELTDASIKELEKFLAERKPLAFIPKGNSPAAG